MIRTRSPVPGSPLALTVAVTRRLASFLNASASSQRSLLYSARRGG